jgi:2Fe-2S ferredoxin
VPKITVITREGAERDIEAPRGQTLMEVIRDSANADLQALCSGCCSCATCHVYIDPAFFDRLPPASDDEKALIDGTIHGKPTSRLSCQVTVTDDLADLRVAVAPED